MTDLDAIRERHQPKADELSNLTKVICGWDGEDWPCDTAQAIARVDELTLERDQQERFKWAANERADKAEARVAELEAALYGYATLEHSELRHPVPFGECRDPGCAHAAALLARPEPRP